MSATVTHLEGPSRVLITLSCGCSMEIKKLDASLRELEVKVDGAVLCEAHPIPTWEDILAQFVPEE